MKYRLIIPITIIIVSMFSCSTSNQHAKTIDGVVIENRGKVTLSLPDRLSRVPGVTVRGTGANALVRVRGGANSFGGDTEPLFVVNGQALNSYATAYGNVDPNRIKRIKVLKGADASSYGFRGGSGVVEIFTK